MYRCFDACVKVPLELSLLDQEIKQGTGTTSHYANKSMRLAPLYEIPPCVKATKSKGKG